MELFDFVIEEIDFNFGQDDFHCFLNFMRNSFLFQLSFIPSHDNSILFNLALQLLYFVFQTGALLAAIAFYRLVLLLEYLAFYSIKLFLTNFLILTVLELRKG